MRARPTYSEEFKESAVDLLQRTDRTLVQVARDLGVSRETLGAWYKRRTMGRKKNAAAVLKATQAGETSAQRLGRLERENAALRRENESLKMDREILKKAAAFFAKESE